MMLGKVVKGFGVVVGLACAVPLLVGAEYVMALRPDKDPDAMLEEKGALSEYLGEKLGGKVEVITPLAGAVVDQGFANGTVDLAYLSSTNAVQLMDRGVADVLLAGRIEGKPYYESYWLTLKEKPYGGVEDLRGHRVAFSSRTSTSGFIIPVWDLGQRGLLERGGRLEDYFGRGNVFFGTGYVSAVRQVLNGQAEAAAVSDYVYLGDRHLTEEERGRLRVIGRQGPVPTHVIAVRRTLPEERKEQIRRVFLEMNEANPDLRDRLFTSELVEADGREHVENIESALGFVKDLRF